jgi:hypothetical protein
MNHANLADLKEIHALFQNRKDVFPHVRQDKLRRMIEAGQVVWQDGVVITYQQYKKRTRVGEVQIPAGSIMLHQILNSRQFSGKGGEVFEQFVKEIVRPAGGDLYLSVRKENAVACSFYERHGMKVVGKVSWSGGRIPGLVYRLTVGSEPFGHFTRLGRQPDTAG